MMVITTMLTIILGSTIKMIIGGGGPSRIGDGDDYE